MLIIDEECIYLSVQKTIPAFEIKAVNAALIHQILCDQKAFLLRGGYICDGARSMSHETNFQEYLQKYFGFRKAYCKLHIEYSPKIKLMIKMLYPFRKLLQKLNAFSLIHQLNSVLQMETLIRENLN